MSIVGQHTWWWQTVTSHLNPPNNLWASPIFCSSFFPPFFCHLALKINSHNKWLCLQGIKYPSIKGVVESSIIFIFSILREKSTQNSNVGKKVQKKIVNRQKWITCKKKITVFWNSRIWMKRKSNNPDNIKSD